MSRLLIAAVVVAVVLTVYAVIDAAMTDPKRTRALSKPVWLFVIIIVPVVGPLLWILFGKGLLLKTPETAAQSAPDDDEAFLRSLGTDSEHADRIRKLEDELRALDEQIEADGFRDVRPGDELGRGPAASADDTAGVTDAHGAAAPDGSETEGGRSSRTAADRAETDGAEATRRGAADAATPSDADRSDRSDDTPSSRGGHDDTGRPGAAEVDADDEAPGRGSRA